MSGISNIIEDFLKELILQDENGIIEIQRNQLAEEFNCSPSQINYVLSTRFTPYQGYYIESKRGGGGYVRIMKVKLSEYEDFHGKMIKIIGDSITKSKSHRIIDGLEDEGIINNREAKLMKSALGDGALKGSSDERNSLRADILINMLLILAQMEGMS